MLTEVIQEPAVELVDLATLKNYLKVDVFNEDDDFILTLEKACREALEDYCNRAFITQTLRNTALYDDVYDPDYISQQTPVTWYCRTLAERPIRLRLPLQSVTSVTVYDEKEQAYPLVLNSDYFVNSRLGEIYKYYGIWPGILNYMVIEYKAGYGDTADKVPNTIKVAIMRWVAFLYEHREEFMTQENHSEGNFVVDQNMIPKAIKRLVSRYRVLRSL